MSTKGLSETQKKVRKTLMQLAGETSVRDPAAHAKNQVSELDKTAKRSLEKRKAAKESIEADEKEMAALDIQIAELRSKYDPLLKHLEAAKADRERLKAALKKCIGDEKNIMGSTKDTINARRQDESKLTKKIGTIELELLRGYGMGLDSTFAQTTSESPYKAATRQLDFKKSGGLGKAGKQTLMNANATY